MNVIYSGVKAHNNLKDHSFDRQFLNDIVFDSQISVNKIMVLNIWHNR